MRARESAALFLLAALWGGSFLFIRVAAPALGPLPLAAGRVAIAALALWCVALARRQRHALRPYAGRLLVLGALNAAVPFALIGAAELRLTASLAAMLNATVPLWATLFAARWLGERVTPRRGASLVLGVAGVAVLVGWSPLALTVPTWLAIAAMLVATACYAAAGIYAKRRLAGVSSSTLALGQQLGALAWIVLPALWQAPRAEPTPAALGALLALALLSTTVAYVLYFHLIATIGPTRTTTVTYLIPVFGTAWGALFLGERVTPGSVAGLAIILASVLLMNARQANSGKRTADSVRTSTLPAIR